MVELSCPTCGEVDVCHCECHKEIERLTKELNYQKDRANRLAALFDANKTDGELNKLRAQVEKLKKEIEQQDEWRTGPAVEEIACLRAEFIKPDPYGDEARATVIWQDDDQVTQIMWNTARDISNRLYAALKHANDRTTSDDCATSLLSWNAVAHILDTIITGGK